MLLALTLLGGTSCAPNTLQIKVIVDQNANSDYPVMISVVSVHDEKLVPKLLEITATQWFQQRETLVRDFSKSLSEELWEFVPGQSVPMYNKKLERGIIAGFLFAKYRTPGVHRYSFDPSRPLQVVCGPKGLVLPQ